MTGRRAFLISLMLLVLGGSAVASNATASGTTAFTCVSGGLVFTDAHCDTEGSGSGSFGHVAIVGTTEAIASNNRTGTENSSWVLKSAIAGIELEVTCGSVQASMSMTNNAGPPMTVTGSANFTLGECKLLKPVAQAENCTVTITQFETTFTTTNAAMGLKFSPLVGTKMFRLTIGNAPGKTCKSIAGIYFVEGTAKSTSNNEEVGRSAMGATQKFTTTATESTLSMGGSIARLEGSMTLRMGPKASEGNPIAFTTE